MTITLNPSIIGQAEKHHTAVLARALAGTTLDEKQWITLNVASAAGEPIDAVAHTAKVATMTQIAPADVAAALDALVDADLMRRDRDRVEVTAAGSETVGRIRAVSGDIVTRAYGAVAPEELAVAARVLSTITARLAAELAA
ncbi:hypothetical protein [Nocardia stercoris]|uniref:MarR family transcriptional regulator n=1 Tax=Nocardia stercoris TaxID=2483361 RepID=A0A3M2LG40_9NOCA|nr:hypothetical protein [Nocardia stercoris]RMI35553.1 hypothetical protein EBN03_04750 [Nocardia stercoris]